MIVSKHFYAAVILVIKCDQANSRAICVTMRADQPVLIGFWTFQKFQPCYHDTLYKYDIKALANYTTSVLW